MLLRWEPRFDLLEELSKVLYHNNAGMTDDCYLNTVGEPRREWLDLEEWERDEYRWPAKNLIKTLIQYGLLKSKLGEKDSSGIANYENCTVEACVAMTLEEN